MKGIRLALLLVLPAVVVFAQKSPQNFSVDRAAQYYLGTSDELLIPINVWGFVQKPGQYMVPDNTDLVALLSFAGGPAENARLSHIRIIRNDPKTGNVVYKIDVKRFIETADERLIPNLRPGDTIIVDGTTFHWVNRFFEFVSRLAIIAQIYYLIAISESYKKR
jgi:hypothetical protein